ncbi:MAG: pyridoxamine 5'-phosphate oxidase family protein [Treponema sp.]|nr:pyridoxamine 5'-phosphate oxidase family protein [Treponema sp.]
MVIDEKVKQVIADSAFLTLVTVNTDGTPHPIIAGKGKTSGDQVVFGIYKMEQTQKNLLQNHQAWIVGATTGEGPQGFRLKGTAVARDKQLIFTATHADRLI